MPFIENFCKNNITNSLWSFIPGKITQIYYILFGRNCSVDAFVKNQRHPHFWNLTVVLVTLTRTMCWQSEHMLINCIHFLSVFIASLAPLTALSIKLSDLDWSGAKPGRFQPGRPDRRKTAPGNSRVVAKSPPTCCAPSMPNPKPIFANRHPDNLNCACCVVSVLIFPYTPPLIKIIIIKAVRFNNK